MSKNLLITGGTGSLGYQIVHNLSISSEFDKILIYSRDEHKQEKMAHDFRKNDKLRFLIGDVRDKNRLDLAMWGCTHVIHAAAMKIIPIAEYNPMECLKTNIIGTQNVIECAMTKAPCTRKVLLISSDKAVHPKNLYGASKLCAEKLFIAANNLTGKYKSALFNVIRYGNVANSNGSVMQVFEKQWLRKEPFTITHEDMTRYWITLNDAATFVISKLDADTQGEVFIPKMPSFKITDLAKAFDETYGVVYIGIRNGEKLHEEIEEGVYSNQNDQWLDVNQLRDYIEHGKNTTN